MAAANRDPNRGLQDVGRDLLYADGTAPHWDAVGYEAHQVVPGAR